MSMIPVCRGPTLGAAIGENLKRGTKPGLSQRTPGFGKAITGEAQQILLPLDWHRDFKNCLEF
jgi:hypothetical protein